MELQEVKEWYHKLDRIRENLVDTIITNEEYQKDEILKFYSEKQNHFIGSLLDEIGEKFNEMLDEKKGVK